MYAIVCYTAVFRVVTQRWGGALRDDTKNGCSSRLMYAIDRQGTQISLTRCCDVTKRFVRAKTVIRQNPSNFLTAVFVDWTGVLKHDCLMMTLERRHDLITELKPHFLPIRLRKLFYKSNRPHFLWVYRRGNPLGMLGDHSKSCKSRTEGEWFTSFLVFSQHP